VADFKNAWNKKEKTSKKIPKESVKLSPNHYELTDVSTIAMHGSSNTINVPAC
jgi:hypothetical protein